ncbi:hypothetical protein VUJ46_10060 [Chryseobacterium sp. MYb264]|uniref:hypothetical protein n=1 Tax=Chryseobacterium sp. MYb264 TaxID=2745153 RepID=UPI002E0F9E19|nr:hypothetical protein VUJ46_10060 [Chryseobacterium sp. MYb264]
MIFNLTKKLNFTSIYYTIFEGLAKGGNQLLLVIIATFINKELYLKLMLLISLEALITMSFFSYYVDVLYSYKKNKIKTLFSGFFDFSIIQILLYIGIYFLFQKQINQYYNYNLHYVILFIIGNAFVTTIVNYISVSLQISANHKLAIQYKSIPFFLSFVFCIVFFLTFDDKVLAFFLGKFSGISIFFIFFFIKNKLYKNIFKFKSIHFISLLKRVKYSMIIAFIGWGTGLGFLNFSKIYSGSEQQLLALGLLLNMFSMIQLLSNGINQVYVPKLKELLAQSMADARTYTKSIKFMYIKVAGGLLVLALLLLIVRNLIPGILPKIDNTFIYSLCFVILVFFLNIFQWISAPYLMILDKYKYYFFLKLSSNAVSWILMLSLIYLFHMNNFIIFYFIIQLINSFTVYYFVNVKYLKNV